MYKIKNAFYQKKKKLFSNDIVSYHPTQVFIFVPDMDMCGLASPSRKELLVQLLGVLSAESLQKEAPAGRELPRQGHLSLEGPTSNSVELGRSR